MKPQERGLAFERHIADVYRRLGARRVIHNTILDGSQIDLLVVSELPDGTSVNTIVECKDYACPVGVEPVAAFSLAFQNLHNTGKADKGVLVSQSGFTAQAKAMAAAHGVELYEIADLDQKIEEGPKTPEPAPQIEEEAPTQKYVFVLMPFIEKFNNVFWFGIRGAVEDAGCYCERADEILFTGNVLDKINQQMVDFLVWHLFCFF